MGFFNWANMKYTTDGKGVEKQEKRNPVGIFFGIIGRKFWKFVTLNLTYAFVGLPTWCFMAICATSFLMFHVNNENYNQLLPYLLVLIPFITLVSSPATMGVTYVLRNFAREEHAWVPGDVFDKASKNYKQGIVIGLINSVVAFLLLYSYFYYAKASGGIGFMNYLILLLGLLFLMMRNYIYPLAVTYRLSIGNIYRYAMVFVLMKLPQNFLIVAGCLILIYASFTYINLGMILSAVILISLLGFLTNFYCDRVIQANMQSQNERIYPPREQKR